eukprot:4414881-Lingulodinium_polyedra.AAC.1
MAPPCLQASPTHTRFLRTPTPAAQRWPARPRLARRPPGAARTPWTWPRRPRVWGSPLLDA